MFYLSTPLVSRRWAPCLSYRSVYSQGRQCRKPCATIAGAMTCTLWRANSLMRSSKLPQAQSRCTVFRRGSWWMSRARSCSANVSSPTPKMFDSSRRWSEGGGISTMGTEGLFLFQNAVQSPILTRILSGTPSRNSTDMFSNVRHVKSRRLPSGFNGGTRVRLLNICMSRPPT
jgi:hypothetical protein